MPFIGHSMTLCQAEKEGHQGKSLLLLAASFQIHPTRERVRFKRLTPDLRFTPDLNGLLLI